MIIKIRNKIVRNTMNFINNNKYLYKIFIKFNWYKIAMYEEAQTIIGNRKEGFKCLSILSKSMNK